MLDFFERETEMKFVPTLYSDYHPDVPGGVDVGRSVLAAPFDTSALGDELKRLRPPLKSITFMGMMFNLSNAEIRPFFNATKSARSAAYVARRLASHFWDLSRYGRGTKVTSGNARAARLTKSAFYLEIPIDTDTTGRRLIHDGAGVHGDRSTNESNSYHDFGAALIAACDGEERTERWLIYDHPTIRKYGLGYAKPSPMPLGPYRKNSYLQTGRTLAELTENCGISPAGLTQTVEACNVRAREGRDPAFGRGTTSYNRYLADPDHRPNPSVASVEQAPFYALRLVMGDRGTFDGLSTTVGYPRWPIAGLYAADNNRASIMGGNYPGAGIALGPAMTFGHITSRDLAGLSGTDRPVVVGA
jgi:hypothetical protein